MNKVRFGELNNGTVFRAFGQEMRKLNDYNAETTGKRGKQNFLFFKQNLVEVEIQAPVETRDVSDQPEMSQYSRVEFKLTPVGNKKNIYRVSLLVDGEAKDEKLAYADLLRPFVCRFSCVHRGKMTTFRMTYDLAGKERWKIYVDGRIISPVKFNKVAGAINFYSTYLNVPVKKDKTFNIEFKVDTSITAPPSTWVYLFIDGEQKNKTMVCGDKKPYTAKFFHMQDGVSYDLYLKYDCGEKEAWKVFVNEQEVSHVRQVKGCRENADEYISVQAAVTPPTNSGSTETASVDNQFRLSFKLFKKNYLSQYEALNNLRAYRESDGKPAFDIYVFADAVQKGFAHIPVKVLKRESGDLIEPFFAKFSFTHKEQEYEASLKCDNGWTVTLNDKKLPFNTREESDCFCLYTKV